MKNVHEYKQQFDGNYHVKFIMPPELHEKLVKELALTGKNRTEWLRELVRDRLKYQKGTVRQE